MSLFVINVRSVDRSFSSIDLKYNLKFYFIILIFNLISEYFLNTLHVH
jgi:hypothetical protein